MTTTSEPRRGGEVAREPVDALDVEVVGRLVEQQQLGVATSSCGQRDPAPLAARQRRDRRVEAVAEAGAVDAAEQPVEHVAEARVARPLVVGAAADELLAHRRAPASRSSPWPSSADARPPTRVTPPASGSSTPAISRSSVDLPSPLRPTTPIRSPSATPSVTPRRTVRVPSALLTSLSAT